MSQFIIREWQPVTKGFFRMECGLNSEICFPGLALQQILVAANRSRNLHFQHISFSILRWIWHCLFPAIKKPCYSSRWLLKAFATFHPRGGRISFMGGVFPSYKIYPSTVKHFGIALSGICYILLMLWQDHHLIAITVWWMNCWHRTERGIGKFFTER